MRALSWAKVERHRHLPGQVPRPACGCEAIPDQEIQESLQMPGKQGPNVFSLDTCLPFGPNLYHLDAQGHTGSGRGGDASVGPRGGPAFCLVRRG